MVMGTWRVQYNFKMQPNVYKSFEYFFFVQWKLNYNGGFHFHRSWSQKIVGRYLIFIILKMHTYVPSKPRTESSASLGSMNSTKANPGGLRATQTFLIVPYLQKIRSMSCLDALFPKLPTYTLQDRSHSRNLDICKAEIFWNRASCGHIWDTERSRNTLINTNLVIENNYLRK